MKFIFYKISTFFNFKFNLFPKEMQVEYTQVADFREHFTVPRWKKPWPFAWRYGGKDQYDQVLKWASQQPQLRSLELYIALEGIFSTEFRCTSGQGLR